MVYWVIGSILYGGPIELFLIVASIVLLNIVLFLTLFVSI